VAQPLGLNFRVAAPSWFFEGAEGLGFPPLVLDSVDGGDAHWSVFPDGVEREAARLFLIYFKQAPKREKVRYGGWTSRSCSSVSHPTEI
jgi:hypothetical protein